MKRTEKGRKGTTRNSGGRVSEQLRERQKERPDRHDAQFAEELRVHKAHAREGGDAEVGQVGDMEGHQGRPQQALAGGGGSGIHHQVGRGVPWQQRHTHGDAQAAAVWKPAEGAADGGFLAQGRLEGTAQRMVSSLQVGEKKSTPGRSKGKGDLLMRFCTERTSQWWSPWRW